LTPKEQMIAQLKAQLKSEVKAVKIVEQIEIHQKYNYLFAYKQRPKTVGEYFKKHKTQCLKKFQNT
jgi:hypothetical protein